MGVQQYREADIQSISREKLLVLLYEKMGADLLQARRAIADGDRITMADRVAHSQHIIAELRGALDHSVGGEVSRNLEALYDYLFAEHLAVLVDRDPRHLDHCLLVLRPLVSAWRKIPPGTAEKADRARSRQSGTGPGDDSPVADTPVNGPQEQTDPGDTTERRTPTTSLFSVSA